MRNMESSFVPVEQTEVAETKKERSESFFQKCGKKLEKMMRLLSRKKEVQPTEAAEDENVTAKYDDRYIYKKVEVTEDMHEDTKNELTGDEKYYIDQEARIPHQRELERRMNACLTTMEDIEKAALKPESGVNEYEVTYEGKPIKVYELDGIPFTGLVTALDYTGSINSGGGTTRERLIKDPSVWAENLSEAKKDAEYGTKRGNTISASIFSTKTNMRAFSEAYSLFYGFCRVNDRSIIDVRECDAQSRNFVPENETEITQSDVDFVDRVIVNPKELLTKDKYTEVCMHRYDIGGNPQRPDYVFTHKGLSESIKKHASYWGVPIVLYKIEDYVNREKAQYCETISHVSEGDEPRKIIDMAQQLQMTTYGRDMLRLNETVDNGTEERSTNPLEDEQTKKFRLLELEKRVEYFEDKLQEVLDKIKKANEEGAYLENLDVPVLAKVYKTNKGDEGTYDALNGRHSFEAGINDRSSIEIKNLQATKLKIYEKDPDSTSKDYYSGLAKIIDDIID